MRGSTGARLRRRLCLLAVFLVTVGAAGALAVGIMISVGDMDLPGWTTTAAEPPSSSTAGGPSARIARRNIRRSSKVLNNC